MIFHRGNSLTLISRVTTWSVGTSLKTEENETTSCSRGRANPLYKSPFLEETLPSLLPLTPANCHFNDHLQYPIPTPSSAAMIGPPSFQRVGRRGGDSRSMRWLLLVEGLPGLMPLWLPRRPLKAWSAIRPHSPVCHRWLSGRWLSSQILGYQTSCAVSRLKLGFFLWYPTQAIKAWLVGGVRGSIL